MRKTKTDIEIVNDIEETNTPILIEKNDLILWSYESKRNKLTVHEESIVLLNKIGKTKIKDLAVITELINLHNEYRFPLVQLTNTSQKSIDTAKEFLTFLSDTKK